MPLSIKDAETEQLARRLADVTGESITRATKRALEERLRRFESPARRAALLAEMDAIRESCRVLPVLDHRSPDEILGYDENGLPT